jgi:hypothetical protein
MYYIINRSALLMNFDTKKRLGFCLNTKKGENFFSFFSSEKAESLGAVEKLSQRSTPTKVVFLFVRNE